MKKHVLCLTVTFIFAVHSFAQVCPTNTNNSQYNEITNLGGAGENPSTTPFSFSYVPGAGTNRLMIVVVTYETESSNGPNNFNTVIFGGKTLTNVINQTVNAAGTQHNRLGIYYLKESNIATAVGNTLTISFTSPGGASPNGSINGVAVNTIMLENVNQTTPLLHIQNIVNTSIMSISVPLSLGAGNGNFMIAAVNMALATATVGPSNPAYTVYVSKQVAGSHTHSVSFKQITSAGLFEQPGFVANTTTRQIVGSIEVNANSIGGSCNVVLPLHLISFNGNMTGNYVNLNWNVESENGIESYRIQRSKTADKDFITIGEMAAHNNSASSNYSFSDPDPNFDAAFYRLEIPEWNGKINYSNVIKMQNGKAQNQTKVASFFSSYISINTNSVIREDAIFSVADANGRNIMQKKLTVEKGNNSLQLAIDPSLTKGIYFLSILKNGAIENFKIIRE